MAFWVCFRSSREKPVSPISSKMVAGVCTDVLSRISETLFRAFCALARKNLHALLLPPGMMVWLFLGMPSWSTALAGSSRPRCIYWADLVTRVTQVSDTQLCSWTNSRTEQPAFLERAPRDVARHPRTCRGPTLLTLYGGFLWVCSRGTGWRCAFPVTCAARCPGPRAPDWMARLSLPCPLHKGFCKAGFAPSPV